MTSSATGAAAAPSVRDLTPLRTAVRGRVLLPGEAGFDTARTPWDLTVDQAVAAVVEIADADDAVAVVRFARDAGLSVAAQNNGHSPSVALNETILVRTHRLSEVDIDPTTRSARVGAGASWGAVQAAAEPYGLLGVSGSSPVVGVTGYTLGGGLSWFSRKYGWAADSVIAFGAVDADGNRIRASATSNADLFWAMRGGGGDYALITSLEFALKPAASLYGGAMSWPAAQASKVLAALREIADVAPDELTLWWSLIRLPDAEPLVAVYVTYLGAAEAGRALLKPFDGVGGLVADDRRMLSITDLGAVTNEQADPVGVLMHGTLLSELNAGIVDELLAAPMDPVAFIQIRHLGGALTRPTTIPAGAITEPYYISFAGLPTAEQGRDVIEARIADYLDIVAPARSGRTPFNFLTPQQNAADALDPDTLGRLREIKLRHDPTGVFRSNHPVLA